MHVTLRVASALPTLRGPLCGPAVARTLRASCAARADFRIVHFCVVSNHLHLICEAHDAVSLGNGVRFVAIRLARGINARTGRMGRLFATRYHARILRTPREVHRTLLYVINNQRRHSGRRTEDAMRAADLWSSGPWFDGWAETPSNRGGRPPWAALARTWLLSVGWRRHGLHGVLSIPGSA